MKTTLLVLALGAIGVLAWIRLAPSVPSRWHVGAPAFTAGPGRVVMCDGGDLAPLPATFETLARLDAIAMATPRTRRLAGSVGEGHITWITRSRAFGFPDFTTALLKDGPDGPLLCLLARQRFGSKDFGVNRARIDAWLAALG